MAEPQYSGSSFSDNNPGLATVFQQRYDPLAIHRAKSQKVPSVKKEDTENVIDELDDISLIKGGYYQDELNEMTIGYKDYIYEELKNPEKELGELNVQVKKKADQLDYLQQRNLQQTAFAVSITEAAKKDEEIRSDRVNEYRRSMIYELDENGNIVTGKNGRKKKRPLDEWDFPEDIDSLIYQPGGSQFINYTKTVSNFLENFKAGTQTVKTTSESPEKAWEKLEKVSKSKVFAVDAQGNAILNIEEMKPAERESLTNWYRDVTGEDKDLEGFIIDEVYQMADQYPKLARGMQDFVQENARKLNRPIGPAESESMQKYWLTQKLKGHETVDYSKALKSEEKEDSGSVIFQNVSGGFGGFSTDSGKLFMQPVKEGESYLRKIRNTKGDLSTGMTAALSMEGKGTGLPFAMRVKNREGETKVADDFKLTHIHLGREGEVWVRGTYLTDEYGFLLPKGRQKPDQRKKKAEKSQWIKLDPKEVALLESKFKGTDVETVFSYLEGYQDIFNSQDNTKTGKTDLSKFFE